RRQQRSAPAGRRGSVPAVSAGLPSRSYRARSCRSSLLPPSIAKSTTIGNGLLSTHVDVLCPTLGSFEILLQMLFQSPIHTGPTYLHAVAPMPPHSFLPQSRGTNHPQRWNYSRHHKHGGFERSLVSKTWRAQ